MSETPKKKAVKRVNKTPEQLENELKMQNIRKRMDALAELEDKLGCVFVPLIQYTQTGSRTYIAPMDAPAKEVQEEPTK